MADLGSPTWSEIDASNNAVPPNGWPEGMAPSDVNNSARAQMGGEKRWWDRSNATQTTTGTSTAYVLTYASTESALYDGEETSFVLHTTCGATPTLNRDGLGAKLLRKYDRTATAFVDVEAGDYLAKQVLCVRYNIADDRYDVISDASWSGGYVTLGGDNTFTGVNQFENAVNEHKGADIASATTTDIGAMTGNYGNVTGTTTIAGLGTVQEGTRRTVNFTGILTLTHNSTSLILPGGLNIVTAAGDTADFVSLGSGNWKLVFYQRASLAPYGTIAFLATKNGAAQTLTDEVWAKLTFGTETFDLGSYYDTGTSRWTPPAGTYLVNGRWGTSAFGPANVGSIAIYVNGSRVYTNTFTDANGTRDFTTSITQVLSLNGTDYVELWGYVNTAGSPQDVAGAAEFTTFSGSRL